MQVIAFFLLAGCPALTAADLEERKDLDGDDAVARAFGGDDCDDRDPTVHPGAVEVCDGVDNDCDDLANELDPELAGADWWLDADGDGYGRAEVHERTCADLGQPREADGRPAWVHDDTDCDDTDPDQFPGQEWDFDGDGDGWGIRLETRRLVQCTRPRGYVPKLAATDPEDCDDSNLRVHPGAEEVCDAVDDDCDDLVDVADPDLVDGLTVFPDGDRDGWGDETGGTVTCGEPPEGLTVVGGDCDDADPSFAPGRPDPPYDGRDTDCLGNDDDDADGDGHAHQDHGGDDCDDAASWIHPGAQDLCDGVADDCRTGAWTEDEELEGVVFLPSSGAPIDWTVPLRSGAAVVITSSGTLRFCGAGPWTGSVELRDPFGTTVEGGKGDPVLDATGTGRANLLVNPGLVSVPGDPGSSSFDTVTRIRHLGLVGGEDSCLRVYGSTIEVEDVTIEGCSTSGDGGGAWLEAQWDLVVRDSRIAESRADGAGGGLHAVGDDVRLEGVVIEANQAPTGSGLTTDGRAAEVTGSTIVGNFGEGWRALGPGTRTMTSTVIRDHADPAALHTWTGLVVRGGLLTCGTGSRIAGNDLGVGVLAGTFVGDGCNLGSVSNDNGIDVSVRNVGVFDYGATPAPFSCDTLLGCVPL